MLHCGPSGSLILIAGSFNDSPSIAAEKPVESLVFDEATLIEERRKKREAIKAKYRGQATPLLAQALVLSTKLDATTLKSESLSVPSPKPGTCYI